MKWTPSRWYAELGKEPRATRETLTVARVENKTIYLEAKEPATHKEMKTKRLLASLKCTYCPPHAGENLTRNAKHGAQKPKSKNKRRK